MRSLRTVMLTIIKFVVTDVNFEGGARSAHKHRGNDHRVYYPYCEQLLLIQHEQGPSSPILSVFNKNISIQMKSLFLLAHADTNFRLLRIFRYIGDGDRIASSFC